MTTAVVMDEVPAVVCREGTDPLLVWLVIALKREGKSNREVEAYVKESHKHDGPKCRPLTCSHPWAGKVWNAYQEHQEATDDYLLAAGYKA